MVQFVLTPEELSVVDAYGEIVAMEGEVNVSVGGGQPLSGVQYVSQSLAYDYSTKNNIK